MVRARRGFRIPVQSMKNVTTDDGPITTTNLSKTIVLAVSNPDLATQDNAVENGCSIRAVHFSIDVCGLSASGVNNQICIFIMKNPGFNLTPPNAGTEGSSNEKKYIIKTFQCMAMRNQDGNNPCHWEGWLKIPRPYQRFGADDVLQIVTRATISGGTGHFTSQFIYKWYT